MPNDSTIQPLSLTATIGGLTGSATLAVCHLALFPPPHPIDTSTLRRAKTRGHN
jgi:hypothetical protein